MTRKIYNRVAAWNAARYEQEFNLELQLNLLTEELDEWIDAETEVDKVDALCDLLFVAYGALWKLSTTEEELTNANSVAQQVIGSLIVLSSFDEMICQSFINALDNDRAVNILRLFAIALFAAMQLGLIFEDVDMAEEAVLIVCDSNDSKAIKKTASNIKANIDKGANFVAPEPRLQELLDRRIKRG